MKSIYQYLSNCHLSLLVASFVIVLSLPFNLRAQLDLAYGWAHGIGSSNNDSATDIATDNEGNVYVTGLFGNTVDFDPGIGVAELVSYNSIRSMFLAKYDADGNYIYAIAVSIENYLPSYSIHSNSVAVDSNGNAYITGYLRGTADFDPGTGTAILTSTADASTIFVAKYDTNGNCVYANGIGSSGRGHDIIVDNDENVYVTGAFSETSDFDPGPGTANLTSNGIIDFFFAKYDSFGNYVFAKSAGSSISDYAFSIALDDFNNIYLAGFFWGIADFDPGPGTANLVSLNTSGNYAHSIFFAKYDSNGNYIYAKKISGAFSDGMHTSYIALGPDNSLYITGYINGTLDFDPSDNTVNLSGYNINQDIFFAKYDSEGNYEFAKLIGGISSDRAYSIAVDDIGNAYISGVFRDTVDFDPGRGLPT